MSLCWRESRSGFCDKGVIKALIAKIGAFFLLLLEKQTHSHIELNSKNTFIYT